MTDLVNVHLLHETGQTAPFGPTMSREEHLEAIAQMFEERGTETFWLLPDLEDKPIDALRGLPTGGNIFEPIVEELNRLGISTEPTVGGVMRALALDAYEIHDLACTCHTNRAPITGKDVAERVRWLAFSETMSVTSGHLQIHDD